MAALPKIKSQTVEAVERAVAAKSTKRQSRRIGGSTIGKCARHVWYRFRWALDPEDFEPRMMRLFETGHLEEARIVRWLQDGGIDVLDRDPATDEQWAVSDIGGHFFGFLDGIAENVPEAPKTVHLLEVKTHNAKSFAQLLAHGVAVSKPEHVDQMQVYMHLKGITRALYVAKNKDNDELYAERVEYDAHIAAVLMLKAETIIKAHEPPPRIGASPEAWSCKFCSSRDKCHGQVMSGRNCRTCLHSTPELDGEARWSCALHRIDLSIEAQESGCPHHLYLPSLVPGDQVDAGFDASGDFIVYQLADGSEFVDRGRL